MSKALQLLGIARMSGNVGLGEDGARALVKAGKARLLLLADDASDGTKQRAAGWIYGFRVPLVELPFTKAELGHAVGRTQCAVAAVRDLGLAGSIAEAMEAEYGERYAAAAEALRGTQARIKARRNAKGTKSGKRRKRDEQL